MAGGGNIKQIPRQKNHIVSGGTDKLRWENNLFMQSHLKTDENELVLHDMFPEFTAMPDMFRHFNRKRKVSYTIKEHGEVGRTHKNMTVAAVAASGAPSVVVNGSSAKVTVTDEQPYFFKDDVLQSACGKHYVVTDVLPASGASGQVLCLVTYQGGNAAVSDFADGSGNGCTPLIGLGNTKGECPTAEGCVDAKYDKIKTGWRKSLYSCSVCDEALYRDTEIKWGSITGKGKTHWWTFHQELNMQIKLREKALNLYLAQRGGNVPNQVDNIGFDGLYTATVKDGILMTDYTVNEDTIQTLMLELAYLGSGKKEWVAYTSTRGAAKFSRAMSHWIKAGLCFCDKKMDKINEFGIMADTYSFAGMVLHVKVDPLLDDQVAFPHIPGLPYLPNSFLIYCPDNWTYETPIGANGVDLAFNKWTTKGLIAEPGKSSHTASNNVGCLTNSWSMYYRLHVVNPHQSALLMIND